MKTIHLLKNESNLGGFILLLGTVVILITILFEYKIGWIGVERPPEKVPLFVYDSWGSLRLIWGWQVSGYFLHCIAYLLLLKNSNNTLKSVLFATLLLCGLLIVTAFGLTLGGYYPALEVYETQPELFDTLRGAIRTLYAMGGLMSFLLLGILYLLEVFGKDDIINKRWGIIGLGIVLLGIGLSFVPSLPGKLIGATIFFIPTFLGLAYWTLTTKTKS